MGSTIKKKSGVTTKRMHRLAPTLLHICKFIWESTSRLKQFAPRYPSIAFWGGIKGSNICKSGKDGITAGPIGTKLCAHNYADGSGNGHRMKNIGPVRYQGKHFNPIFGDFAL